MQDTGPIPQLDSSSLQEAGALPPVEDSRLPSLSGNRLLLATVALSFVLLMGTALLVFEISRESAAAEDAVVRTLEVKQAAADLLNLISTAEAGQRGYLLTGDEALLAPYEAARSSFDAQLAELRKLLSDNAPQSQRLDELTPVLVERLGAIEQTLSFAREQRRDDAVRVLRQRGVLDLRERFAALDRAENQLLLARQEHARSVRNQFLVAVTTMLVACGVLAIFALVSVRRYLRAMHESRTHLATYSRELERRVAERTQELAHAADTAERERMRAETLLTDVNHRVGNNLALVSSFLTMQQRVVRSPDAVRALGAARARVQAIASAHRKLRLGTDFASVKANEVLGAVLDDIAAGLPPGESIAIRHELQPLSIAARDAVTLGVLTSELVMNAVKHAFPAGENGEIRVVLACDSGATLFLEVSDNGVGWYEKHTGEAHGLGARIVEMVARQFGGVPERSVTTDDTRRPGARIRIGLRQLQVLA